MVRRWFGRSRVLAAPETRNAALDVIEEAYRRGEAYGGPWGLAEEEPLVFRGCVAMWARAMASAEATRADIGPRLLSDAAVSLLRDGAIVVSRTADGLQVEDPDQIEVVGGPRAAPHWRVSSALPGGRWATRDLSHREIAVALWPNRAQPCEWWDPASWRPPVARAERRELARIERLVTSAVPSIYEYHSESALDEESKATLRGSLHHIRDTSQPIKLTVAEGDLKLRGPHRANPDPATVDAWRKASEDMLLACGVDGRLVGWGDASAGSSQAARELRGAFLRRSVAPVLRELRDGLARILRDATLRIDVEPESPIELRARASAAAALVEAGVDKATALDRAGLGEPALRPI